MGRRRAVRAGAIAVGLVLVGQVGGLALNAASNRPTWPGALDYVRRYPWWFILGTTIVLAALVALDRHWSDSDSEHSDSSGPAIDLHGSTFHGPVALSQGAGAPAINSLQPYSGDPAQALPARQPKPQPLILFYVSPFLDASWEATILTTAKSVNSNALCVRLDEKNLERSPVASIVIAFSAAQRVPVKKPTLAKMRSAKEKYPSVQLIFAAVGLTDEPIATEDGHRLLKTAGYDLDNARFIVCATEDEFQSRLSSHLGVAVEVGNNQSILDQGGTHIPDREIES